MMTPLRRFIAWLASPAGKGGAFATLACLFVALLLIERAPATWPWRGAAETAILIALWVAIALALFGVLAGRLRSNRNED